MTDPKPEPHDPALVDWLRSQFYKDEQVARAQVKAGLWSDTEPQPPQWLIEVKAKQVILEICEADLRQRGDGALDGRVDCPTWDVLIAAAQTYAGRAGFRDEWRYQADR